MGRIDDPRGSIDSETVLQQIACRRHANLCHVLLNSGHTFGHAPEVESGYTGGLLHGEGVAVALGRAFGLSARLGHCKPAEAKGVIAHVSGLGLPAELALLNRRFFVATLIDHLRRGKKVQDWALKFVLARGIGQALKAHEAATLSPMRAVVNLNV